MNEKQKPSIRFKGFVEDWGVRKILDLGNIVTGSTPPTKDKSNYDGDFLFVSPADIQGNRYVINTITTLTEKGFNKSRILKEKSILFVSIGSTIGKVAQILEKATTNQQINAIEPYSEYDEDFIFTLMEKTSGQIKSLAATQAVPIVNKTSFEEVEMKVPLDIVEQTKIGVYFSNLDHLITLHQRKYDKLVNIKQSMLEKMFPRDGENVPEIRFAGFTEDWEERKLGDIVQITMGQSPDGSTYSDIPSEYILVQGNADLQDGWVFPRIWTTQMTKKADAGDLVMSVRAPAGAMGKTAYNVVIGRGVAAIKGNEFIYQLLVKMNIDGYWKALSCGSTFESLNSDNIKNAEVLIPNSAEQDKIGEYFKGLDNLITLHQSKLEKLQNIKKSMLEKMFV